MLRSYLFASVFASFFLLPFAAGADYLPRRGSCSLPELFGFSQIEWDPDGSAGVVLTSGIALQADMVGMREHSDGFKVSFQFLDPILDLQSEIVLMNMSSFSSPRASIVRFEEVEGVQILHSVFGFEDVECIYR